MLNFVIETEFKSVATLINNYDKKKKLYGIIFVDRGKSKFLGDKFSGFTQK